MKILAAFLTFVSGLFIGNSSPSTPPLNADIITYNETYFAPAVAEPGNFPLADKSKIVKEEKKVISESPPTSSSASKPALTPSVVTTPAPIVVSAPIVVIPTPIPVVPPQDPYLVLQEPIANWFWYSSFNGNSADGDRTLPEMTFDREYWRVEVLAYWAPAVTPPKPDMPKDFFKLEVYEKATNKLIYTMTPDDGTGNPKRQTFRKPGAYYFKVYSKDPSQYEINFTISSKLAQ